MTGSTCGSPESLARIYGGHRVGRAASADEVWYVSERGPQVPALLAMPGARLVASTSPLTPAEDAELDRLQADVAARLVRAGEQGRQLAFVDSPLFPYIVAGIPGMDTAEAGALGTLNARVARHDGCRCAIVAVPGGRR